MSYNQETVLPHAGSSPQINRGWLGRPWALASGLVSLQRITPGKCFVTLGANELSLLAVRMHVPFEIEPTPKACTTFLTNEGFPSRRLRVGGVRTWSLELLRLRGGRGVNRWTRLVGHARSGCYGTHRVRKEGVLSERNLGDSMRWDKVCPPEGGTYRRMGAVERTRRLNVSVGSVCVWRIPIGLLEGWVLRPWTRVLGIRVMLIEHGLLILFVLGSCLGVELLLGGHGEARGEYGGDEIREGSERF